jgi:hypothetical protein
VRNVKADPDANATVTAALAAPDLAWPRTAAGPRPVGKAMSAFYVGEAGPDGPNTAFACREPADLVFGWRIGSRAGRPRVAHAPPHPPAGPLGPRRKASHGRAPAPQRAHAGAGADRRPRWQRPGRRRRATAP